MNVFTHTPIYKSLLSLFCVLASMTMACGDMRDLDHGDQTDKVIGGKLSKKRLAVVGMEFDNRIECTGTMITKRAVLTAAHCILRHNENGQLVSVDPEKVVFTKGKKVHKKIRVVGTVAHPEYARTGDNDLAILYLASDAPTQPIKYFTKNPARLRDQKSVIVGFGVSDDGSSEVKREAKMKVIGHDGEYVYAESPNRQHRSSCYGDSGGPVFVNQGGDLQIAGVLSTGSTIDCSQGDISYYTRVDDEKRWIRNNLNP